MKQGDYTNLAKDYVYRPSYGYLMVDALLEHVGYKNKNNFLAADVGAGTGKFAELLLSRGLNVVAVEPNEEMRNEGIKQTKKFKKIQWLKGRAEKTGLRTRSVDWVVMASSFHWTNPAQSLPEFYRILKPQGFFTAIWNPRNIEDSLLQREIEKTIYDIVPTIKRKSSGSNAHTPKWEKIIASTGHFQDVIFMETDHFEKMSQERYMHVWRSVNDVRAQAGEKKFALILRAIEKKVTDLHTIVTPYKIRAWTARRKD